MQFVMFRFMYDVQCNSNFDCLCSAFFRNVQIELCSIAKEISMLKYIRINLKSKALIKLEHSPVNPSSEEKSPYITKCDFVSYFKN